MDDEAKNNEALSKWIKERMKVMKEFRTSLQKLYGNNEVMPIQSTGGSSKKTRRHKPPLGKKKSRNKRNRISRITSWKRYFSTTSS